MEGDVQHSNNPSPQPTNAASQHNIPPQQNPSQPLHNTSPHQQNPLPPQHTQQNTHPYSQPVQWPGPDDTQCHHPADQQLQQQHQQHQHYQQQHQLHQQQQQQHLNQQQQHQQQHQQQQQEHQQLQQQQHQNQQQQQHQNQQQQQHQNQQQQHQQQEHQQQHQNQQQQQHHQNQQQHQQEREGSSGDDHHHHHHTHPLPGQGLQPPSSSSPFEFDDYFNYRLSGMDYNQYYNIDQYSDSNSEDEGTTQQRQRGGGSGGDYGGGGGDYGSDSGRGSQGMFDPDPFSGDLPYPRRPGQTASSITEEEENAASAKVVDPGPFQYNKRVFITALPCLLLTLIMTGETLLLMLTIGGLLIVLMAQWGGDVSKRCVVVFALLFIPSHILVVGTVLPLLWLSLWNVLMVGLVNFFCILTGGWVILQFQAFRKEELDMCIMIERALFCGYPFVCSALVTWILSTVVYPPVAPFLFISIWFVCLQLYLMPAATSFKQPDTPEDEQHHTVLAQPVVLVLILLFSLSGPLLHTTLTIAGYSTLSFFSLPFLTLLMMVGCLGVFLATLLNLRQLCDYWGWRHSLVVHARWGSGAGVITLCYPILQQHGVVSHLLLSLPLAAACFTGLGVALSLKRDRLAKVLPVVMMALLMLLLCVWMAKLPWALTYEFLGGLSLKAFQVLVGANFVLSTMVIYSSWHHSKEVLGCLLLLQSIGLTVCELGLYQAGLYSKPAFQLTGMMAAYACHRLYLANKLTRSVAALSSTVQLTKTALGALTFLLKEVVVGGGGVLGSSGQGHLQLSGGGGGGVDVSTVDYLTLLVLVGMLVWLFVYESKDEVTLIQAGKHVVMLMVALGVSAQSFLLPLGDFLLQDNPTLADLVGLWYVLSGSLMVLYCLGQRLSEGLADQLMKGAGVMAGVGAVVIVMQPQFSLSLYALYQWTEVLSVLLIAALLTTPVDMSMTKMLVTAVVLGVCPGIHATFMLYEDIPTVLHFVMVCGLTCQLLALTFMVVKRSEVTQDMEKVIQAGVVLVASMMVGVLCVDVVNFEAIDSVWDYPAFTALLATTATISLCLKALAVKLGPHQLPLVKREEQSSLPTVPTLGNIFTILTVLLAATQGPVDSLLHDLWVCASSLILTCLQRDPILLPGLSPSNRATPTVMTAIGSLVINTLAHSRLWHLEGALGVFLGLMEVLAVLGTLPVYAVLAVILWRGRILSEKAVVFCVPLNAVLLLVGSGYTAWLLCVAGLVSGLGMMFLRLPLLPDNFEPLQQ